MGEQAPAGWYPDEHGNERYWDGSAWTEQLRQPGGADATSTANTDAKKEGAFSKLKKAAADKQAEKRSAREDLDRKHAEAAQAAGQLVTSGVFGTSTIEIYEGGYVRVASGERPDLLGRSRPGRSINVGQPVPITKNTPYEKLRSIKFTQPGQEKASNVSSQLEGAVGPAVASLMKGGKKPHERKRAGPRGRRYCAHRHNRSADVLPDDCHRRRNPHAHKPGPQWLR